MTDWLPDLGGGKAIKEIRKQVEKLEQIVRQHKQRISDNTSNIEYNVEIAAKEVDRFEEEHKRDMLKIEELQASMQLLINYIMEAAHKEWKENPKQKNSSMGEKKTGLYKRYKDDNLLL